MSKIFYDHLIVHEEIYVALSEHDVSEEDKVMLAETIDETVHHHVIDTIMTHLPKDHHELFLDAVLKEPHHPKHMQFLKENTKVDIEKEIEKTAETVKNMILRDIKASSNYSEHSEKK